MLAASVAIDRLNVIAPVRRDLFGGFVEQMGRGVYTGIYEPGHPSSDQSGYRADVVDLVRELGLSSIRYPGGNFVSGYRWEDGVGPKSERQPRVDLAWNALESNQFGLDEFVRWARKVGAEPMMAVNLGTRGIEAAVDLLEYSNMSSGTRLSDLRRSHGAAEPYRIRTWCLGNEMDGPWQLGRKSPEEYGRLAAETAGAMRRVDPDIRLVVCGSSGPDMPWFGEWERIVLGHAYDRVDLISAHAYYQEKDHDLASFLASSVNLEEYLRGLVATIDHVRAAGKHRKQLNVSFDEWNVWYQDGQPDPPRHWASAEPRLEDRYSIADAVVVGSLLMALLRNSDRVHNANLAQLVNVIAPVMTEPGGPAWRQTTFHPFRAMSEYSRGDVLAVHLTGPEIATRRYGDVPALDFAATWDENNGSAALFAVNRDTENELAISVDVSDLGSFSRVIGETLSDADPYRVALKHDAHSIGLRRNTSTSLIEDRVEARLPPASWSAIRLTR